MNNINLEDDVYDVIVIGAGIAGLTAAYTLKKKVNSLKILILEARDRVGGRTHTVEMKCSESGEKAKWDLGGQWVTDTQTNITRLINELQLETYTQFDKGKKILENNGKVVTYSSSIPDISLLSLVDIQLMLNKVNSTSKRVSFMRPFENMKLATQLDKTNLEHWAFATSISQTSRTLVEIAVRSIFGLEIGQINALFGLSSVNSAGSFEALALCEKGCAQEKKIKGGTQQISEKLLSKIIENSSNKIVFNTETIEVNQNDKNIVEIKSKDTSTDEIKTFRAKKVVCAIPTNLIGKINFKPDLSALKKNVLQSSRIGNFGKFVLTYKRPFWRANGYSGELLSDGSTVLTKMDDGKEMPFLGPICCMYDATTSDDHAALVGFLAGDALVQWNDQDADTRRKEIIESVVRFFGAEARDYIDFVEKMWNTEKYTGGCPVNMIVTSGVMKDYARSMLEPFLNVHFCGTETALHWQGYMDGAVESGERVANEILYTAYNGVQSIQIEFEKTFYYQISSNK